MKRKNGEARVETSTGVVVKQHDDGLGGKRTQSAAVLRPSSAPRPLHPGLYSLHLRIRGPGGTVSRHVPALVNRILSGCCSAGVVGEVRKRRTAGRQGKYMYRRVV
ncbi:hypothetical protein HL42_4516 [Trichophyton rubrum]|nr:hypothetical protein HL42_4516 [Trichophyton rubrum]